MQPLQALNTNEMSTVNELDAFANSIEGTTATLRAVECTNDDLKNWRDGVAKTLGKLANEARKMKSAREKKGKTAYRQARTRLLRVTAKLKKAETGFNSLCQ